MKLTSNLTNFLGFNSSDNVDSNPPKKKIIQSEIMY